MIRRILPLCLGAALLFGCAAQKTYPPASPAEKPQEDAAPAAEPPIPPPVFPTAQPPAPPATTPMAPEGTPGDKAFVDGMAALKEGGQERALELFAAAWKERPGHPGVSQEFDAALIGLKQGGDAAYAQGKMEEAGKRWAGTLRYLNHPAARGKSHPFTRADVQGQIDRLTAGLMEKGLLDYRKGNIEAAIADWKTILAYDPGNEEAAKYLKTASTQLDNLKKLPPTK